jgi:trigger factor
MKVDVERLERSRVQLTVEVDEAQVAQAVDEACMVISEHVNIPGFRKGKVPRRILERRLGKEAILKEAAEELVEKVYPDALRQADISPLSKPEISIEQIEENKPLIFKATLDVVPTVELGQYTGIEAEYKKEEITDEHVETTLKEFQRRHTELVAAERDVVEQGDVLTIDYEGFIDGVPFEGGKQEGAVLKIGSGTFIPGFEEQLVGMKRGETQEIKVTFPEDYGAEDLAGKEAVFNIVLHEIKTEVVPELDDEFAKDVSTFETLAEFREDLRTKLQEEAEKHARDQFRSSILEKIVTNASIDLPDSLVDSEIQDMLENMKQRLSMQGFTWEQYLQLSGKDEADLRKEMESSARENLKTRFVMSEIQTKEGITVTDEDVEKYIEERVNGFADDDKQRMQEYYQKSEQLDFIKRMQLVEKTFDFIEENAVRTEGAGEADVNVDSDSGGADK